MKKIDKITITKHLLNKESLEKINEIIDYINQENEDCAIAKDDEGNCEVVCEDEWNKKEDISWVRIGDLEWSEDLGEMTWQEAMDKAKELGVRVPTRLELLDLFDNHYEECQELIKDSPSNIFWSAIENSATNAWYVSLNFGATSFNRKTTYAYQVRCVR